MPIRLWNLKLSPSSPDTQAADSTAINKTARVPLAPWVREKMKLPTHICRCQPTENRRGEKTQSILGCLTIKILCPAFEKSVLGKLPRDSCDCSSLVKSCLMTQTHTHSNSHVSSHWCFLSLKCHESWELLVKESQWDTYTSDVCHTPL